ncbi:Lipopolysaccharide-responsive and beige-like anchor protein [Seminavis robusta]|uniref:Lipopolysaccharide-responsive and beige-like anchor protein n=1 Tax=Seminavis robusta TaxID=568900 RepID=A0A9N8DWU9_9STRA|nr:Lipopolysaccharide-responsive and beige-like anchor protein [Seminavis robusta]|eukprot:Sro436_g142590.1 Lipopolysaccharide-responsive and beige-like anchor protein (1273) ;mRNA; f:20999-25172
MTISWFQSSSVMSSTNSSSHHPAEFSASGHNSSTKSHPKLSIAEAVKTLHPSSKNRHAVEAEQTRFSQLLLEHGEKHLQDWAVIAYSSPAKEQDMKHNSTAAPNHNNSNNKRPTKSLGVIHHHAAQPQQPPPKRRSHKTSKSKTNNNNSNTNNTSTVDAEVYPSTAMNKIEGRLHLCSRSIVFEPTDPSRGIVRCPFRKMDQAPTEYPPVSDAVSLGERFESMCIEFRAQRHVVMKEHAAPAPFTTVPAPVEFRFTFLHSSPQPFCDLCQKLFTLWSQQQNSASQHEVPELDELLQPMLERPFDSSHLVDVRERPLTSTSLQASLLTPLQRKSGCVTVTTERIYFQPAAGALTPTDTKAMHWRVPKVVATACRYNGLRDCALELYFRDATSVLLAFERKRDREQLLRFLPRHAWSFTDREFLYQVVKAWHAKQISNYDYLLALNTAAGRSFHDLSRYPVFPWVIKDFESAKLDWNDIDKTFRDLSKPVGALNPERLQYFKTRLEGMQDMDDSFLYGTHYSTPGYVLYFLVRSMPEQMLCLQNGKFDAPDRMFYSMNHCFNCVQSNHADVKELLPEFYNPDDYDFLINARGLQLGATQTGERVDDVMLPPWAKSARDFLRKSRKALESEHCTKMLPKWIDLIFGSKSRGDAAKEADNLFHSCCYLGDLDLAAMKTEHDRFQAELQATEFGLVPDQLFVTEHPSQVDPSNPAASTLDEAALESVINPAFGTSRSLAGSRDYDSASGTKAEAWELLDPPSDPSIPNQTSSGALVRPEHNDLHSRPNAMTTATTTFLQQQNAGSNNPFGGSSSRPHNLPLSGSGDTGDGGPAGRGAFSSFGAADNGSKSIQATPSYDSATSVSPRHHHPAESIQTPTEWDMKLLERRQIHGDAVSGCELVLAGEEQTQLLATTSLDGGLMAHTVSLAPQATEDPTRRGFTGTLSRFSYMSMSRGQAATSPQSKLTEFRRHSARDPLACLVLTSDGAGGQVAFAGGHDDVVLAYGINSSCAVASVYSHRDAVTGLDLIPRMSTSNSALWLEKATHVMVSGSWDATVKVWSVTVAKGETVSVNREPLAELYDADSSIVCVSAVSVQHLEPNGGAVVAAGCADGSFCVWNLHGDGVTTVIHNEPAKRGSGPCSVLKWSTEGGKINLFTGFSTGKVASLTLEGGVLRKESALSFGVAVNALVYSEGILLVGCADGGLRLIPVSNGTKFDGKPSLWPAVNNRNSPGISSINVTYAQVEGRMMCICCTGAEDGSVALFELKRVVRTSGFLSS